MREFIPNLSQFKRGNPHKPATFADFAGKNVVNQDTSGIPLIKSFISIAKLDDGHALKITSRNPAGGAP